MHSVCPSRKALTLKLVRAFAALLFAPAASAGMAEDWRYSIGVHDFVVPDANSHTYGLNGGGSMDKRTDSGLHLFGSFDIFLDVDRDHLDSDHILLRGEFHFGSDGDWWRSNRMHVGWTADVDTKENTVSAIERQITAFPAFVAGYDGQAFQASLEAGAGWFFLELDDDAPREQGYDRNTLVNSTFAYAATARLTLRLGESWTLSGRARGWWDGHRSLESQYQAVLRVDARSWLGGGSLKQPALLLSADYYKYNLDVYNRPDPPPILHWNEDLTIRLSLEARW